MPTSRESCRGARCTLKQGATMTDEQGGGLFDEGDIISVYPDSQAVEDGVLVDIGGADRCTAAGGGAWFGAAMGFK